MSEEGPPFHDILCPYFEQIPESKKFQCTVYGPKDDVNELRKKIEDELKIKLPQNIDSFDIYVKKP